MQHLIKAWIKYFIVVGLFGFCVNLIYLAFPLYVMVTYDRVLFSVSHATLWSLALGILICLLVMALLDYLRARMLGQAGYRLAQDLTPQVLNAMADRHSDRDTQYTRGLYDLERLRQGIVQGQLFILLDWAWVLLYVGVLFLIQPLLGLVAVVAGLMLTLFQWLLRRLLYTRAAAADVALATNADFIAACFSQDDLVQGLGMRNALLSIGAGRQQEVLTLKSEADSFQRAIGTLMRLLARLAPAAVFTAGVWLCFREQITAGALVAALLVSVRLFQFSARSLADLQPALAALAAWRRLKQYVKPLPLPPQLTLPPPAGRLEAENLTLALNGRMILQQINLSLEPGTSLGIIGPASAGKTALCKALLGIWPLAAGTVRLDGADIHQWPREELARTVGWLPQPAELLPVSVAANIARLGSVETEEASQSVMLAAEAAGVHATILQLPQGYDTPIQSGGRNLAASQRQNIALARALFGQPQLVVLDCPNTHQDDAGLKFLSQLLARLKSNGVTTIVVTDRPSLLGSMDQLLVLKEGRMALYGATREVYKKLSQGSVGVLEA